MATIDRDSTPTDSSAPADPAIPPIVDRAWLTGQLTVDDSGVFHRGRRVVVCDVRSTMTDADPRGAYDAAHLPGALFVSLEDDLSTTPGPIVGRHPLASPEHFAEALAARGVSDDAIVLAHDDRGGAFAGRLVWMLRTIGQPATLVDGAAVSALGEIVGHVHPEPAAGGPATTPRIVRPWPAAAIADADRVTAHLDAGGVVVDARDAARYAGVVEPIDAVAGHIPGAINMPFSDNLDTDGGVRRPDELARRFAAAGVDGDAIVYCGSGVTACHDALAIEHAGLGLPAVYVASWSGWSSDPGRAAGTGSLPHGEP